MDREKELSFGLDTVRRSSEFKLGMLARRSGLLSLASWIKNGGRDRLTIHVPPSRIPGLVIESIHSCEGEPALPWDMIDVRAQTYLVDSPTGAYGRALCVTAGSIRAQVTPTPLVIARRGPDGPRVEFRLARLNEWVDLSSEEPGMTHIHPGRSPMVDRPLPPAEPPEPAEWTRDQRTFVEQARARRVETVAVFVPRWLGVSNSTRVLFENTYPVPAEPSIAPASLSDEEIAQHADVLTSSGVRRIVFSGGDEMHYRLMLAIRERDPSMRFDLVFHGNFVQLQDPYVWSIFNLWLGASRDGLLHTFVTVKKGFEEVLRSMGVRAELLLNYVPGPTMAPPKLDPAPPRVGIWTSGTIYKSVDPMLAAIKLMPDAVLHAAGIGEHGVALAQCLDLPQGFVSPDPVSGEELPGRIRAAHVSLYVTFSECSPMLPLESLQVGVPCLVGPSSHLFEDEQYLFDRLVVPFPDRPDVIARYALRAIDEREQIILAWRRHAVQYNAMAQEMVRRFLSRNDETALRPEGAVAWR